MTENISEWDTPLDAGWVSREDEQPDIPGEKPSQKRSTVLKRHNMNMYRRAFSETQLLDIIDLPFKNGDSYHFITGGDVDSLSYLKLMVHQQPLDYCLFSTWCMASEDVYQIKDWLDNGKIKRIDAYVGEIFPGSYRLEYGLLKPVIEAHGGRVCVFKNHAKIFAGYGAKFYFGIETSANINTNPRTENGCITIGKDIYDFYREYFDGVISFEK
ncbi:MAG: hypothetical protein U1C57_03940 [Candidatus Doudnabacteria bacterium]|nr:hypothetical protein [Candidatus Doudnabacteria bacterium]